MRSDAAAILISMGYVLDRDFIAVQEGSGVRVDWYAQSPMPTEAEIDAIGEQLPVIRAKQRISAARYAQEIAGISIEGQPISSERDEIGHWYPRFANAYGILNNDPFALASNPTKEFPYKPKNGRPTILTAQQVVRAYQCLSWYVNTCFGIEKALFDMLDAGTPIEAVLDAMPSQWPQREFTWEAPQ